jgi:tetratricopeptide (TPR) repeat protein
MQLNDLNLKIITVHPSSAVRQLMNAELRGRGYQDVLGVSDLSDVVALLESQSIHWVITPPSLDGKNNVFQLLKIASEEMAFVDLRVSLILDEPMDPYMLSKAFDIGLLSYHERVKTKIDIEIEFKTLFEREHYHHGALDLVAGEYLRSLFIQNQRWIDLLRFEKSLFQLHRGNIDLSFKLAEAQLRAGEKATAAKLLSQIATVDPDKNKEISTLWQNFEQGSFVQVTEIDDADQDMLGVRHCVVVDPDFQSLMTMKTLLLQLGIQKVETFSNSNEALQYLEEGGKPEIILFEWASKPMAGPIFAQKLREIVGFGVPLTVINSELSEQDMPLLREMGVTNRIRKPIESSSFFKEFLWLVHQDRAPTEPFIILQKIKQAMADSDFELLAKLTKRYMESDKCSSADKSLLQAELSYFRGHFSASRDMALNTLKSGMVNVEVLNTLGKSLMKMRDFETALRCFETAQMVSPKNVRRICNIAESNLELGDMKAYERILSEAKDLDPTSTAVMEVDLKGALVKKDAAKAQSLMQSLKSLLTILSFTNNRAISLIRCDHFQEGIDLYREALQAVPAGQVEIKGILQYNLALALARLNRIDESKHILLAPEVSQVAKISPKAKSLLARVNKALQTGEKFALNREPSASAAAEGELQDSPSAFDETMMALKVGPGDHCLHKVFVESRIEPRLKLILDKPLNLKRRLSRAS